LRTPTKLAIGLIFTGVVGGYSAASWLGRSRDRLVRTDATILEALARLNSRIDTVETYFKQIIGAVALQGGPRPTISEIVSVPDRAPMTPEQVRLFHEVRNLKMDRIGALKNLAAWITSSLAGPSPDDVFDERTTLTTLRGACGARDILLTRIAQEMGIATRRIAFYGNPIFDGHTATEVFLDGDWRFMDSTFGIYFTRPNSENLLSISEARALYPNIAIWRSTAPLWTGEWLPMREFSYAEQKDNLINGPAGGSPLADIERTYFASKMVGAPEQPIIFSDLVWDIRKKKTIKVGSEDGSAADMSNVLDGNSLPLLERVGRFTNIQSGTKFRVLTDEPVNVSVRMVMLQKAGYLLVDLDHRAGRYSYDQTKIDRSEDRNSIVMKFKAFPPNTSLSIWSQSEAFGVVDNYQGEVVLGN